ncbi:MAG: roadblock/LC7 domain-containing protein [Microthrixaceae bacterium]|jgi:predicted regulator of Ras-like GTPase activity (Roadblock/LC7/MglB family)|nr:roadblock/LC7 domain-containing protein [Microthrixaceae bacterium]
MSVNDDAQEFNWLLNNFVSSTSGVSDAVAVSSDGLLMARSNTLDEAGADQLAAIISGFVSLGDGTTRCFGFEELNQIIVAMKGGYMFVSAMGTAGCLGVVAEPRCDIGNVGYQMTLLVERAGRMLTPELIDELKNLVMSR